MCERYAPSCKSRRRDDCEPMRVGMHGERVFIEPAQPTRTRLADALLAPASPTVSMQASEQSIPGRVVRTTTATPSPCASLRATPAATSRPLSPPSRSKPGSGARARSRVGEFEPPEPEASSASTKQHVISWLHFDTRDAGVTDDFVDDLHAKLFQQLLRERLTHTQTVTSKAKQ